MDSLAPATSSPTGTHFSMWRRACGRGSTAERHTEKLPLWATAAEELCCPKNKCPLICLESVLDGFTLSTPPFIPRCNPERWNHPRYRKWKTGQDVQDYIILSLYVTARASQWVGTGLLRTLFFLSAVLLFPFMWRWMNGWTDGWIDGLCATGNAPEQYLCDQEWHRWWPRAGVQSTKWHTITSPDGLRLLVFISAFE